MTRLGFSLQKFTPDFTRFNPASKIKRMVQQGPVSILQAAAMLVVFGCTIYLHRPAERGNFLALPFASLEVGLQKVGGALKELLWKARRACSWFLA